MLTWGEIFVPPGYSVDATGVFQTTGRTRIAGPVWVSASTHDHVSGDHGVAIAWIDPYGDPHQTAVTRDELHGIASFLPSRLARGGLDIVHGKERKLLEYLTSFDVSRVPRLQAITRVGWIEESDNSLAYMLPPPATLVAAHGHAPVIFQPESEHSSSGRFYSRGTLGGWNASVIQLCKPNPLLLFPVLVALSGAMLRFAEMESGGFHYYGRSSHGKTTAAQAAASVWGNGSDPSEAPDRAYIHKWNSTANAFEALLMAHNDGLLILDEIQICDTKDFGALIYTISGGKGRHSLNRDRQLRAPRQWRTGYFSTGEESVIAKIQSTGREAHAGQLLRLIDIPISSGTLTSVGETPAAEYADQLKSACGREFGTAGPALIRRLVSEYGDMRSLVGTVKAKLEYHNAALTKRDAPPEIQRATKRFSLALLTGEICIKLGVLDCEMQHVESAVRVALHAWLSDASNVPDRIRGIVQIAEFIQRHESRFQRVKLDREPAPRDRAGFVGNDEAAKGPAYMFTSEGFSEACGNMNPIEIGRELRAQKYLVARDGRHLTEKRDFYGTRLRVYVVRATILEFDPMGDRFASMSTGACGASGAGG